MHTVKPFFVIVNCDRINFLATPFDGEQQETWTRNILEAKRFYGYDEAVLALTNSFHPSIGGIRCIEKYYHVRPDVKAVTEKTIV